MTARDPDEVGRDIRGIQVANVDVTARAITKDDVERAAKDTLDDVLDEAKAKLDEADAILNDTARQALQLHQPSTAEVLAGKEIGIPRELSGWLTQGAETTDQILGALARYPEGFGNAINKFSVEGGQFFAGIDLAVEDSYARGTLIEDTWNNVVELGSSAVENAGYLGTAVKTAFEPHGSEPGLREPVARREVGRRQAGDVRGGRRRAGGGGAGSGESQDPIRSAPSAT